MSEVGYMAHRQKMLHTFFVLHYTIGLHYTIALHNWTTVSLFRFQHYVQCFVSISLMTLNLKFTFNSLLSRTGSLMGVFFHCSPLGRADEP